MPRQTSTRLSKWIARGAFGLGAVLFVAALLRSVEIVEPGAAERAAEAGSGAQLRAIRVETVDGEASVPIAAEAPRGDFALAPDEANAIAISSLPSGRALRVELRLPVALPSEQPLPARILALDGSRELSLGAAEVAADRSSASVAIESGWLAPGEYLIELQTSEPSHLPLRRYRLEIR
jgi:hypothetical protein